jgi:putative copper export protein
MEIDETLRSVAFPLVRTAAFGANALLFGLAPVILLVLRPTFGTQDAAAFSSGRRRVGARLEGFVQAALVASAVATLLLLLLQVTIVAELTGGRIDSKSIQGVFETSFGRWTGIRLLLLFGLGLVLVGKVRDLSMAPGGGGAGRLWWAIWMVLAGAVLVTNSLAGHAASAEPVPLSVANDALHLIAGSVWFAGIVVLSVVLPDAWTDRPAPDRLAMLAPAVDRFATVALVTIAIAGVTGVANSLLNVAALNDLVDSGYGRTVVLKLSLFAGILGFGAVNHYMVRRSLVSELKEGRASSAQRVFRKTIAAELAIAVGIMAATGLLVGLERTRL